MPVVLTKAAALICIAGSLCQPVLYGESTPSGAFTLTHYYSTRLHDDVLMFTHQDKTMMSIHRVWRGSPQQHRDQRLESPNPSDNMITNGCVNVNDAMFQRLWALPDGTAFTISP